MHHKPQVAFPIGQFVLLPQRGQTLPCESYSHPQPSPSPRHFGLQLGPRVFKLPRLSMPSQSWAKWYKKSRTLRFTQRGFDPERAPDTFIPRMMMIVEYKNLQGSICLDQQRGSETRSLAYVCRRQGENLIKDGVRAWQSWRWHWNIKHISFSQIRRQY